MNNEKVWFVSDNHFGHNNILRFCPNTRFGKNADEHDRIQIANWQKQVAPNDRVYMLGDVFFCNVVRARAIMDQLPGQKHLIYGNHDKMIKSNADLRNRFVAIHDYHEFTYDGTKIVLFHFPQLEWNRMHHGAFCLFGHVHGTMDNHSVVTNGRTMDVGIDGRPDGEVQEDGPMSLWGWNQIKRILSKRPVRAHHDKIGME